MFEQLGLIGCGLMGGSFALAAKRAGLVKRVVGYSKSPTTTERARQMGVIDVEAPSALLAVSGADLVLMAVPVAATEDTFKAIRHLLTPQTLLMDVGSTTERARQMGVIDVEAPSALLAVSGADLVLMAVPVAATEDTFKAIRHLLTPQTLLMDVGSTKSDVVDSAERVLGAQAAGFVPAHPIAGKEVAGVEHADADLYRDRQVILTPTERTAPGHADRAEALWRALGCQVLRMTPQAHDAAYAAVSHLPHLLAFAFMNGLAAQPDAQRFLSLAGTGFRDFTRIAASDENVWRDILLANRDEVLVQSRHFRAALATLEHSLEDGRADVLVPLIRQAADLRRPWRMTSPKNDDT